ncbi:MAG: hypothetical protein U0T56_10545 [Ferruginibacter sp.]
MPIIILSLLSHSEQIHALKLLLGPTDYHPKLKTSLRDQWLATRPIRPSLLGEILKCSFLARYEHPKLNRLVNHYS